MRNEVVGMLSTFMPDVLTEKEALDPGQSGGRIRG